MRFAIILALLISVSALAQIPKEVEQEIESLNEQIAASGNIREFVERIVENLNNRECRQLAELLSPKSKYIDDVEYFYAKCVVNTRDFGKIGKYEIERMAYMPLSNNGMPPLIPVQKLSLAEGRELSIHLYPSGDRFEIVDISFVYGRKRPLSW